MKGEVRIGEDGMEEGGISTITQLRQIERRGRTQTQGAARLGTAWSQLLSYCSNAAPPTGGGRASSWHRQPRQPPIGCQVAAGAIFEKIINFHE